MRTRIRSVAAIALAVLHAFAAGAAQPQPIATERIADVTLRVLVEGGKLGPLGAGPRSFPLSLN
jgi:hypothetical protein